MTLQANGGVEGGEAQDVGGGETVFNQQVEQGDNAAFFQQHIRRDIVGAHRDLRGEMRQGFQGLDDIRQIGVRAANFEGQTGAQLFQRVFRGG